MIKTEKYPHYSFRVLLFIYIICCTGLLLAQPRANDSLESLLNKKSTIDEEYIDILNELSFEYLKTNPSVGIPLVNKAIKLADSLNYNKGQFRANTNKGSGFLINGLNEQALQYYYKALDISVEGYPVGYAMLYNNLAENFKKQKQYDSAFHYFYIAWHFVHENLKHRYPSLLAANLAECHLLTSQVDSAEYYYNISHKYAIKDQNERGLSYALFGLGEIALYKNQITKAKELHHQALEIREKQFEQRAIIQSILKLAYINQSLGLYELTLAQFEEAERLSITYRTFDLLSECYNQKATFYEFTKDYLSANLYLKKYKILDDSLERQSYDLRVNNIKNALQAELADVELSSLRTERQLQIASIRTQDIIIITVSCLVFILLIFLYMYIVKLKSQSKLNKQLASLNEIVSEKNKEIEMINQNLDMQLMDTSRMLAEGQKITKLGSWEYNVITGKMKLTEETYRHLGISPHSQQPSLDMLKDLLSEETYDKLNNTIRQMVVSLKPTEINLSRFDEKTRKLLHFKVRLNPEIINDKLIRIFGSNQDITTEIEEEEKEREIINSLLTLSRESSLRGTIFDHFIEKLLKESANTLGVERASFWYYNSESKSIINVKQYVEGKFVDDEVYELFEVNHPTYFKALNENRTIAANNAQLDYRIREFNLEFLQPYDIVSMLDAQIQMDGKFLGVLCYEKIKEVKSWTYSDQRYVGTLSDIVSSAFSSYLNKKLEQEKVRLIDRLVKKNRNLQEFAFIVSHNLRGPLTQVMGLSDLYNDPENEAIKGEIIKRIKVASENLDKVIKDIALILQHQDEDQNIYEWVFVNPVINEVLEKVKAEIQKTDARLYIQADEKIKFKTNRNYLFNIILQLIENALKYRKQGTVPAIIISVSIDEHDLTLSVSDNGRGINLAKYQSKLFKMYQRLHLDVPGKGIGLYLIKTQIELLGGHISVDSAEGKGAVFTVKIPVYEFRQPFEKTLNHVNRQSVTPQA